MTLSPEERDALAVWVRATEGAYYMTQIDRNMLPIVKRLLDETDGSKTIPDPYAGKRTVVDGKDVLGGRDDRGITRKSERK